MRYHLMFCLLCLDDGTTTNQHLHLLLGDEDQPLEFSSMAELYKVQRLVSRSARDLQFYAVEIREDARLTAG